MSTDNGGPAFPVPYENNPHGMSLRYYIADDNVTPEEAVRALVAKLYGGEMDVKYVLEAYSQYTIEEWEENLRIGGHDLVEELKSHDGKFAVIVVEEASSPNGAGLPRAGNAPAPLPSTQSNP